MCTFAVKTFENIWYLSENEEENKLKYTPIESKLLSSEYRNSPYKALYGLGSIFNIKAVREGEFPSKLTGLIEPEESTNLSRYRKDGLY